jgi:hypothetical protein
MQLFFIDLFYNHYSHYKIVISQINHTKAKLTSNHKFEINFKNNFSISVSLSIKQTNYFNVMRSSSFFHLAAIIASSSAKHSGIPFKP